MREPGIAVEGVWKKFHRGELHDSLRDLVPAMAKRLSKRRPSRDSLEEDEFWALKDVSFRVKPGEVLGIIGPNGAGKSTMLKILNRILRPNRGRVHISGRVGALIEIAAGFHPDLTGRENVHLQGAIMGMKQWDIRRRFDEIVEFSGVEQFIDTPVKRYSSGMNARLGFSIAAHLDPEVLLIDEVLSVGDQGFQQRAFDRLAELARSGIPVVVVSHQLHRIAALCQRVCLFASGKIASIGLPSGAIAEYVGLRPNSGAAVLESGGRIRLQSLTLDPSTDVVSGQVLTITTKVAIEEPVQDGRYALRFNVRSIETGVLIYSISTARQARPLPLQGHYGLRVMLQMNVAPGSYSLECMVWDGVRRRISIGEAKLLHVLPGSPFDGLVQLNGQLETYVLESTGLSRSSDVA
jgi:lipopolysaccharide transport system ATP-binding protein